MSAMEIDDQPLVDPFLIVNEELHDLICQHFTGKEVKDLSTVSKQWKYSIGVSPAAMKKVTFVYRDLTPRSKENVTTILASERRYSNVKLDNLHFLRTTRIQQLQYDVLEKIASWVKNLEAVDSKIGDIGLKFPRVEKLKLFRGSIKPILEGVTPNKLKTLRISLDKEEGIQPFNVFLMKCSKLEELYLSNGNSASVYGTVAAVPFKLKTFDYTNYAPMTTNAIHNFEKFMLSQGSSLRFLILRRCQTDFVEAALKSLPLLKTLMLYDLSFSEPRQFSVNPSVEILALYTSYANILAALPNLKTKCILDLQKHGYRHDFVNGNEFAESDLLFQQR